MTDKRLKHSKCRIWYGQIDLQPQGRKLCSDGCVLLLISSLLCIMKFKSLVFLPNHKSLQRQYVRERDRNCKFEDENFFFFGFFEVKN